MHPLDNSSCFVTQLVEFYDKTLYNHLTRHIMFVYRAKYASYYDIIKIIGLDWSYVVR